MVIIITTLHFYVQLAEHIDVVRWPSCVALLAVWRLGLYAQLLVRLRQVWSWMKALSGFGCGQQ